jgi:hypothetical protein
MNISILGYPWTVEVLYDSEFKHKYGDDIEATMIPSELKIVLMKSKISHLHIAHELSHAFKYYCSVEGLEFGVEESDEFWCDFIGLHGESITNVTKEILKELNK